MMMVALRLTNQKVVDQSPKRRLTRGVKERKEPGFPNYLMTAVPRMLTTLLRTIYYGGLTPTILLLQRQQASTEFCYKQ